MIRGGFGPGDSSLAMPGEIACREFRFRVYGQPASRRIGVEQLIHFDNIVENSIGFRYLFPWSDFLNPL